MSQTPPPPPWSDPWQKPALSVYLERLDSSLNENAFQKMYAVVGDALPDMTSLRGFTRLHWVILLSTNHPTEMEIAAHQLIKMLFMGASE